MDYVYWDVISLQDESAAESWPLCHCIFALFSAWGGDRALNVLSAGNLILFALNTEQVSWDNNLENVHESRMKNRKLTKPKQKHKNENPYPFYLKRK